MHLSKASAAARSAAEQQTLVPPTADRITHPPLCAGDQVAVEEVEAAQEDGVVLPSRIKQTKEQRRKARSKGGRRLLRHMAQW